MMSLDLSNKVAIVTGAASGIGRATAKLFHAKGARVIGSDRNLDGLQSLRQELNNDIDIYAIDVTDKMAVKNYIEQVYDKYNRIDILANIAGIISGGGKFEESQKPLHQRDLSFFEKTININLYGTIYHCYYVIPFMLKTIASQRKLSGNNSFTCSVINTSSEQAEKATPGMSDYTISKHGVDGLTLSLCTEYSASGIRSNAIKPGAINTPMVQNFVKKMGISMQDAEKKFAEDIPMERIANPQEMAQLFLYLASDASSFCTGSLMRADGGRSIQYSHFPSMIPKSKL